MDKKVLLLSSLLALLLFCVVGAWWLSGETTISVAHAADAAAPRGAVPSDARPDTGAAAATPAPSTAGPVRATAAAASASGLPFPADATWVPVLVVDKVTRAPVAGAEVGWVGETIEAYFESMDQFDVDTIFVWRSLDLQIDRAGWRTTTDENGIARVTFQRWTTVVAADAGRYGQLHLHENTLAPPGGWVLELGPELALTVQVVDEQGTPAADVLLAVGVVDEGERMHFWGWGPIARTRAPDGIAVLRHLQQLADDEAGGATEPGSAPRWRARTYVPGHDDPGVPFALDALPDEPIVLRLPACGRVRARAEVGGRPAPGFAGAGLAEFVEQQRGWRPDYVHLYRPIDADGWVRFAHVPLGREFHASSHGNGTLSTRFTGPIARDQEVTVVITPSTDTMLLSGRMLEAERQPMRHTTFQLDAEGPQIHAYAGFRTDDQGRFLVAVGSSCDDNLVEQLRFENERRGRPPLRLELPPRTLRQGVEDLGDLVMSGGKLIVAGTFLDADGPHRKDVSFWLERFEPTAEPGEAWQGVHDVLQHQDGTGRFELRGDVAPGRLRLAFGTHDKLPMEPVEFEVGAEHLEIRLATGHALAATILQNKGAPAEGLYAVLQPAGPIADAEQWRRDEDRFRVDPWSEDGERLFLQWPALPAGSYTLALHLWTRAEPILRLADVQVPGPAAGDPRLADIDLRAAVRTVVLSLFGADGRPIESPEGVAFATDQDPAATWQGMQIYDTPTKLLLPAGGTSELLLGLRGFQPRRVLVTGDRLDVRLDPWPTLEIVVAGVPELPAKAKVLAHLRPTTPNEAPYRAQWSRGQRGEYFDVPRQGGEVVAGRATVAVGQGPHRVELELVGFHERIPLPGAEPGLVLPNSGRVQVAVPAPSWTAALEQFEQARDRQQERRQRRR